MNERRRQHGLTIIGFLMVAAVVAIFDVRRTFDRYLATDYIQSVRASDLEFTKEGTQTTASVAWTRILPLAGNVSLYLEFEAKATR